MHFARRVLLFYVVILGMFTWLQRTLMYPAGRDDQIAVADYPVTTGRFSKAADVELIPANNEKIGGWHLQVGKQRSERLILLFHGNASHRARRLPWYDLCHTINVDVLAIDYRGYGDSEGKPSEKALTEDALATWDYATRTLGYRADQIILAGESLGGGVAAKLASTLCQKDERPAGLVLVATFSSMLDAARNRFWWLPVRFLLIDRYRSDLEMPHVTCPVLQFHGSHDSIVPLQLAQRLHAVTPLKSQCGVGRQLIVFRGTGHNDVLDRNGNDLQKTIHTWIDVCKKAKSPGRVNVKHR